MSLDTNNLNGSKETLKLLDFAKTVTESIKCALEKTNKPSKKKVNHRKYIQRKCFSKPGIQRKSNRKINKRCINEEASFSRATDDGPILAEDNFQAMLERESEKFYMSYFYMKEHNDITEHFNFENYMFQRESYLQFTGVHGYSTMNSAQTGDMGNYNSWQAYNDAQYPPKLKHFDYDQILVNQQRQRAACNDNSYLAALQDDRLLYGYTQAMWQNMYSDNALYVNKEMSGFACSNNDSIPH